MEDNNPNLNPGVDEAKGGEGTPGKVDNPSDKTDPQVKTFTQEEVDDIINKRLTRAETKFNEKLAELTEAQKLQNMSDEERKQAEIEKALAELEEYKSKSARYEMGRVATTLLTEHKVPVTEKVLDLVVGADAETTKANIEAFVGIVNETASAMVTDKLRGNTPKASTSQALTKEEIAEIADPVKREEAIAKGLANGTLKF